MASLDTIEHTIPRRVLITGLPGSGKSTLAAMLAARGFLLDYIDLENAAETLLKLPQDVRKNLNYIKIPDSFAFPIASQTLLQLFKTLKGSICQSHGAYSCALCQKAGAPFENLDFNTYGPRNVCVVDTATQLGYSVLAHLTKNKPVDYKPERDDWGGLRKYTEVFSSQFQAFPGNLIVIAHLVEAKQADDRTKLVPNFGSAGMSASFAKAFSHVIYMETVNKQHKAYSSSTASGTFLSKSRTGWEIEKLDKPDLFPLFEPLLEAPRIENVIEGESTQIIEVAPAVSQAIDNTINIASPSTVNTLQLTNSPANNALAALRAKMKNKD